MSALWLPLPIGVAILWFSLRVLSPLGRVERSAPLEVPELPPVLVQFLLGRGTLPSGAVDDIVAGMVDAGLVRITERAEGGAAVSPCDGPPRRAARPYEVLMLQRIDRRRGQLGDVPVGALGPGDGEFAAWWPEVTQAVATVAARAGFIRQREVSERHLTTGGLLVGAGSWAVYHTAGLSGIASLFAAVGVGVAAAVFGMLTLPDVRLTREGRAAAAWWRAAGVTRRPSGRTGPDRAWSACGGTWREVEIEPRPAAIWGLRSHLVILLILFAGVEAALLLPYPGFHGMDRATLALLPVPVFLYLAVRWFGANRRLRARPAAVSFDGVLLRRWIVTHEDDRGRKSHSYYCAFDDGTSPTAWTFSVGKPVYEGLAVGDRVHVEGNPRLRRLTAPPSPLDRPGARDA